MRIPGRIVLLGLALGGCAGTIGVRPLGPDTFVVSEMRAPVLGGGPVAQRDAIAEATAFCHYAGRVFVPVSMYPSGFAGSPYGPTAYTATFRCLPPNDPVVARLQADHAPWMEAPPAHP